MTNLQGKKIALSGAFSSGKTTLFRALTARFPQLQPFPEIATAAKSTCPSLDWWSEDVRGYLRWAQIISERGHEQAGGFAIFDGSFADLIAHERAFGTRLPYIPTLLVPRPYALTLLCDPAGIPVERNGIRETEESLRQRIHSLVVEEVERQSLRVVHLQGNVEQRVSTAGREIDALLAT